MSLRLEGLRHVYKNPSGEARQVLDIPAWSLCAGDQVLVRGVSGSGKTTLFNILAGLLRPTAGHVYYGLASGAEQSLYALSEEVRDRFRARMVGYVFQNHHLLPSLTALENVVMPMAYARRLPAPQWKKAGRELLAQVGLSAFADYRPAQLSTGQRLRVAVARALANTPRLLLADEPTAALDPDSSQQVMALLQTTCRDHATILIVASHDPLLDTLFETEVHLQQGRFELKVKEPA